MSAKSLLFMRVNPHLKSLDFTSKNVLMALLTQLLCHVLSVPHWIFESTVAEIHPVADDQCGL